MLKVTICCYMLFFKDELIYIRGLEYYLIHNNSTRKVEYLIKGLYTKYPKTGIRRVVEHR